MRSNGTDLYSSDSEIIGKPLFDIDYNHSEVLRYLFVRLMVRSFFIKYSMDRGGMFIFFKILKIHNEGEGVEARLTFNRQALSMSYNALLRQLNEE